MMKLNPSEIEFEKKNNEILTKRIYVHVCVSTLINK